MLTKYIGMSLENIKSSTSQSTLSHKRDSILPHIYIIICNVLLHTKYESKKTCIII